MKELEQKEKKLFEESPKLVEGIDFYTENNFVVFTELFLEKRGYCCKNGCRHCPYEEKKATGYKR